MPALTLRLPASLPNKGGKVSMVNRVVFVALLTSGVLGPASAYALCGDTTGDLDAVAAARGQVEMQCPCAEAISHRAYRQCAAGVVSTAVASNALPPVCVRNVKRCAARSNCGRPGA